MGYREPENWPNIANRRLIWAFENFNSSITNDDDVRDNTTIGDHHHTNTKREKRTQRKIGSPDPDRLVISPVYSMTSLVSRCISCESFSILWGISLLIVQGRPQNTNSVIDVRSIALMNALKGVPLLDGIILSTIQNVPRIITACSIPCITIEIRHLVLSNEPSTP